MSFPCWPGCYRQRIRGSRSRRNSPRPFSRGTPKIAQGSAAYPLLLQDQRERDGWPGEKVFDQLSYETEYYAFDRVRPVIKLHVGRPLDLRACNMAVWRRAPPRAAAWRSSRFSIPQVIPPLLARLDRIASCAGAVRRAQAAGRASARFDLRVAERCDHDGDQPHRLDQRNALRRNHADAGRAGAEVRGHADCGISRRGGCRTLRRWVGAAARSTS